LRTIEPRARLDLDKIRRLRMTTRKRVVEATRKKPAPQVSEIRAVVLHDDQEPDFDSGDPDYAEQDAERREAYRRGDFSMVGVVAEADVVIEGITQTLKSGGLWGTESDSGEEYIQEIAADEYADLRKILTSIGVSTSQLPTEFDPKWIEWRV
jgi:hypothetical protein